jgi:hypothetical protein
MVSDLQETELVPRLVQNSLFELRVCSDDSLELTERMTANESYKSRLGVPTAFAAQSALRYVAKLVAIVRANPGLHPVSPHRETPLGEFSVATRDYISSPFSWPSDLNPPSCIGELHSAARMLF